MAAVGVKRTTIARVATGLGFACGVIGLLAGLMERTWRLGPGGWMLGGGLLVLIAIYILVDGAIARSQAGG